MRHDGLAGPASTYTLRLAEGVYPNQPNVRRYTVDLKAALFADPRFPVQDIGPFVLAIRKPVGRDWCGSVVRHVSRGRRQTCCPTLARSRSAGPYLPLTNLVEQSPEIVIDAYHQLWRIEKVFRMSKHDLQARPLYHRTRDSMEAHLTIVFAALAVSHWIELPNLVEHQEIRALRTPLPHRHDPSRTTNPDRRRTPIHRPRRSPR
jgi:hypothetical protein